MPEIVPDYVLDLASCRVTYAGDGLTRSKPAGPSAVHEGIIPRKDLPVKGVPWVRMRIG